MSEVAIEAGNVVLTPTETRIGGEVEVSGAGFLASSPIDVEIVLPGGARMEVTIMSDAAGNFSTQQNAKPASVSLIASGDPIVDGDTVTVDGVVYKFVAALADANDVLLGEYPQLSLDYLMRAINLAASGPGETYDEDTELHPTVSAVAVHDGQLDMAAKVAGTSGNSIAVSTTAAELSLSSATLLGGEEATESSYLNFSPSSPGEAIVTATDGVNTGSDRLRIWHST